MQQKEDKKPIKISRYVIVIAVVATVCLVTLVVFLFSNRARRMPDGQPNNASLNTTASRVKPAATRNTWKVPHEGSIPAGRLGDMIRYGRELLAHTSVYLGPKGSVAQLSNGMNCQNCHLDGGTRLFGNDYANFIASYPKMSNRSGRVEPATKRIAECFERSLAGSVPDTGGREVQAMLAYMKWLGQGVKKGQQPFGTATEKLPFPDHPADPAKGNLVYAAKCQSCHGGNGEGLLAADKKSYTYPPLWGIHSYNDGAGMYRIGNFAGFVKNNMPYGATYKNPQLTNEEAWNVAAFVNSRPRPHRDQHADWPGLNSKPIDFPFGPYADKFSEQQHKFGPFKPIKDAQKQASNKKS